MPPDDLIVTNRFPVPGVLAVFAGFPGAVAAEAVARSAGSWSDPVRLASALTTAGFDIANWQPLGPAAPLRAGLRSAVPLRPGDLTAVRFCPAGPPPCCMRAWTPPRR